MDNAAKELLARWEATNEEKNALIEQERELRMEILESAFTYVPEALSTGTKRIPLPTGQELKAVMTVRTSVNKKIAEESLKELVAAGASPEIANSVFRWKPELDSTVYKKVLTDDQRRIVDKALTRKSGLPSLAVETSKKK